MRRLNLLLLLAACLSIGGSAAPARAPSADADESDGFPFPDDRGGVLLRALLAPSDRMPAPPRRTAPKRRPPAPDLESPRLPPAPVVVVATPLPPTSRRDVLRPHLVTEETVLDSASGPELPLVPVFHVGEKVKEPSVDVSRPAPLPILGRPVPDRASLGDATLDASADAALAAPLPRRTTPVPFLKMDAPDPYENRRPLRLPVPDEPATPVTGSPATPKP